MDLRTKKNEREAGAELCTGSPVDFALDVQFCSTTKKTYRIHDRGEAYNDEVERYIYGGILAREFD